jgi:hypothetical protein
MKKLMFIIVLIGLSVLFISCSTPSETTSTPTIIKSTTTEETPTAPPEGSVLKTDSEWILSEKITQDGITYYKLRIIATVQNVGDAGVFYVHAKVTDTKTLGKTEDSIKVYMKKGEEKTYTFEFRGIPNGGHYSAWCTNE